MSAINAPLIPFAGDMHQQLDKVLTEYVRNG